MATSLLEIIGTLVLGIAGSFLASLLFQKFSGSQENNARSEARRQANVKIMAFLNTMVYQESLPASGVLFRYKNGVADRSGVEASDLYSIEQCVNQLIIDTFDSAYFLPSQKEIHVQEIMSWYEKSLESDKTKESVSIPLRVKGGSESKVVAPTIAFVIAFCTVVTMLYLNSGPRLDFGFIILILIAQSAVAVFISMLLRLFEILGTARSVSDLSQARVSLGKNPGEPESYPVVKSLESSESGEKTN